MKDILISGVNGGMGIATAQKFLKNGYNVFGFDIQDSPIVDGVHYYKCDITDDEAIHFVYQRVSSQTDSLSAIISLAGVYYMDSLLEIDNERLKKIVDINSLGTYRMVKAFFPLLKAKSKVIITSSEVAPLDPLPFNGIYSMTKALLEKYAFSLRMELNMFDVDVVVLRPGAVKTQLLDDSMTELDKMCKHTVIHENTSQKFKKIINSVESKHVSTQKLADKIFTIENKKHPKYVYRLNNNPLLKLLNALPDRWQVKIIGKLLGGKHTEFQHNENTNGKIDCR